MSVYVGLTDQNWFEQLRREPLEKIPDVNFWKPGGETAFRVLKRNEMFLFKLKSPHHYIVGGGFFTDFSFLPLSLAWDAFGRANGVENEVQFVQRIAHYRGTDLTLADDPTVGCIILSEPFFLDDRDWIPAPENWPKNVMQGKTYSEETAEGRELFAQVLERLRGIPQRTQVDGVREGYSQITTNVRIGQGAFRVLVTDAYERRCAITGERTLPALEAAHIEPYAQTQDHRTSNGLLLRADLHKLFDQGLITVIPKHIVKVSPAIRDRFSNGRDYYALDGERLKVLPKNIYDQPDEDRLIWHNENRFIA